MIRIGELSLGLRGLWRLVRFQADFPAYFDRSPAGARRSFWLAVPILPLFLAIQLPTILAVAKTAGDGRAFGALLIGYPIMWVAFPLALLLAARLIEREMQIFGAIAVYNWLNVLVIGASLPILLGRLGGLDANVLATADLATYVFYYVVECYAFRLLLGINLASALALTIADLALTKIMSGLIDMMMQGPLF